MAGYGSARSSIERSSYELEQSLWQHPQGLANAYWGDTTLLAHLAGGREPFGRLLGTDGMLVLAFIRDRPANEIALPIAIMGSMAEGAMLELDNLQALQFLLVSQKPGVDVGDTFERHAVYPAALSLWHDDRDHGEGDGQFSVILNSTLMGVIVCLLVTALIRAVHLVRGGTAAAICPGISGLSLRTSAR